MLDAVTGGRHTVGAAGARPSRGPPPCCARFAQRRAGRAAGVAAPSANRFGRVSPTTGRPRRRRPGRRRRRRARRRTEPGGRRVHHRGLHRPDAGGAAPRRGQRRPPGRACWGRGRGWPWTSRRRRAVPGPPGCWRRTTRPGPASRSSSPPTRRRGGSASCWPPVNGSPSWPRAGRRARPRRHRARAGGPADDYAHVLYDRLRQVDRLGADVVVVVPPPPGGLGDAVRDRLRRAAAAHQPR